MFKGLNKVFSIKQRVERNLMAALMALAVLSVNGYSSAALTEPAMPDATSVMQKMVDSFGTAGTYAIVIIGAAVALGVIVIVGMYCWRLLKKWLSSAK